MLQVSISLQVADITEPLAVYQKATDTAFNAIQNNLNVQHQAYNQAFSKLSADIKETCDIKVRLNQDQVQSECDRQVRDLNRQLQELTSHSNAEKARLQAELQGQIRNSEQRISELVKNHQNELVRTRSELSAANSQALNNLRVELEGQVSVAHGEVLRIQSEHESALRNLQREVELTRTEGENRFRNSHLGIVTQNRKVQQYNN